MSAKGIGDTNLYELLDITINASLNDIRTAYRKKALKCHPDKNPDNPKAAELFHELTKALEILLDENARAAYDKLLKAKAAAKLRHSELDEKRKKFKADLEKREEAYFSSRTKQKSEEDKLKEDIARLQKEGARLVQEEINLLQEQVNRDLLKNETFQEDCSAFRIKVQWEAEKDDADNGGYNKEILERIFNKYGDMNALVVSAKKKGQALVEFQDVKAAELAMKIEIGLSKNPLKLKWVDKSRNERKTTSGSTSSLITERDYESLVLTKMRQEAERKRIIEKMKQDDSS